MHKRVTVIALTILIAGPVAASEKTDVMSVVHQWIDALDWPLVGNNRPNGLNRSRGRDGFYQPLASG
jgi:hypothetical protein